MTKDIRLLAAALPAALLASLAGCDNRPVKDGPGATTPRYERVEPDTDMLRGAVTPVRVGELGPSFAACAARGEPRTRTLQGPLPVRAAPFEQAQQIDQLPPSADFHICSRSIDQQWFGIVYDEGGRAAERCGVDRPVPARRDYQGPCAAGWVSSAVVRFVSGIPHDLPAQPAE